MSPIDWQTGSLNWHSIAVENQSKLLLCGDWAPIREFSGILATRPGQLYSPDIRSHFEKADFRALNVESVLSPAGSSLPAVFKEGLPLEGPATAVDDLKALGIDLAFLANNHIYDFGPAGMLATRSAIEATGIRTCGTGSSQEDAYRGTVVDFPEASVAFVNFQEGEEGASTERAPEVAGWNVDRACAAIRRHREEGHLVIAVPHADREYLPWPAPYIQRAYRRLVDAGASAVVAHHPHVPRGIELYNGASIFYSLGNFAFWQDHPGVFRKLGYIVKLSLSPGPSDPRISWQLVPYRIRKDRIESLPGRTRDAFFKRLQSVSGETLRPDKLQDGWHAAIDAISIDSWYEDCTGMAYGFRRMQAHDPVGLARLRTRLSSPSHSTFMKAGITRILDGKHGTSNPQLVELVRLWSESDELRHL